MRRALSRPAASLAALVAAAVLGGCRDDAPRSQEVSRDLVRLMTDALAVKTGPVGTGRFKRQATYVLVEARNQAPGDLLVTLGGELTERAGGQGARVGRLRRESLRIPAGGARLFALVDDEEASRPTARGAAVRVEGASTVLYPPPVVVVDGNVFLDTGRAVVAGDIVNTAQGQAAVVVIAAFFDERGAPMARPSTAFQLDPGSKRGTQMVGPVGSRSAYLFVGEVTY